MGTAAKTRVRIYSILPLCPLFLHIHDWANGKNINLILIVNNRILAVISNYRKSSCFESLLNKLWFCWHSLRAVTSKDKQIISRDISSPQCGCLHLGTDVCHKFSITSIYEVANYLLPAIQTDFGSLTFVCTAAIVALKGRNSTLVGFHNQRRFDCLRARWWCNVPRADVCSLDHAAKQVFSFSFQKQIF